MGIVEDLRNLLGLGSPGNKDRQEFGVIGDYLVSWSPDPVHQGDTVHIGYHGQLQEDGAKEVYLHYGFDSWQNPSTIKMNYSGESGFGAEIQASGAREINFCFRDGAGNWDNNHGQDWSIQLQS